MTDLRNQYLREMGVDVWRLRPARPVLAVEPVPDTDRPGQRQSADARRTPVAEPGSQRESAPTQADKSQAPGEGAAQARGPVPQFHLCFIHYQTLSLVFSVSLQSESLSPALRRFADDIAIALGNTGTDAARIAAVRWPMVRSEHIDQSESAAKIVISQRVQEAQPVKLLFGKAAAHWAGEAGGTMLGEIQGYLENPLTKRELWRELRQVPAGKRQ